MTGQKVKLTIQYDGTAFHGWQHQENHRNVEDVLAHAVTEAVGHPVTLVGAGRTDAGVHAFGMVAHFALNREMNLGTLPRVINFHTPEDVKVIRAEAVPADFHARFSARGKWYRYVIQNASVLSPLYRHRMALVYHPLDEQRMLESLLPLVGEHDFAAFMGPRSQVPHTIRRVDEVAVWRRGDRVVVDVKGKSFLKYMVRIMVGTAIEIGYGKRPVTALEQALEHKDRRLLGKTAPASGLYLMEVDYTGAYEKEVPSC